MITDTYQVKLYINDIWTVYETSFKDFIKTEILYKNLKPADSTCTLTLEYNLSLYNILRTLEGQEVPVKIFKNDSVYYTGYLRKNFNMVKVLKMEPVKVEVVSPSFILKRKIGQNISYINNTVSYILNDLLTKAGITSFNIPIITAVIPGINIESGKETYHQIIEDILFEYGYVGYFNDTGSFECFKLKPDSIETTKEFITDKGNTLDSVEQHKKEEEREQIVVEWIATKTLTNPIVFSDTTNAKSGYKCYIELPPLGYLGGSEEWLAELDHPEGEILSTQNLTLDIVKDTDIEVITFTPIGNKVLLSIKNNNTSVSKFIKKLDIKATSAVVKLEGTNKSIVCKVINTEKIETYTSKYIYEKTYGDELANILAWYYKYSDFTYRITSKTNYNIGDIVIITGTGIGTNTARIVSKKTNEYTGKIEYECDAIDEYTPDTVVNQVLYRPPTPSGFIDSIQTVVQAGLNSDGTLAQPINTNTMITDITPTGDGLYLTKSYVGLRKDGDWKSFIKNDGTFSLYGDANNFLTFNGGMLSVKGNADISGKITASLGSIGGVNIDTSKIYVGTGTFNNSNTAFYLDNVGQLSLKDKLSWNGTTLSISGDITTTNITATGGTIGGSQISSTELKSTNFVEGTSGYKIQNDGFAEFNNINVRGNINSTSGSVGGWLITTDKLTTNTTGSRITLDKGQSRVSIYDSSGVEKVVMGYLSGLDKNSGSGTYTTSDYGFWVKPGNTVNVDGPMKILNGDLTASDASIKVLSGATELLRLGTDTATNGLHLYHTNGKVSLYNDGSDRVVVKSDSGYITIGCQNSSYAHFYTDRTLGYYFNKGVEVDGNIKVYGTSYGITSTGDATVSNITNTGSITLSTTTGEARYIVIGNGRTADGVSYIDFTADTTYTDYGFRIIRGSYPSGANANTELIHRGTGNINIKAQEAGGISFYTSGYERLRILSDGRIITGAGGTIEATKLATTRTIGISGKVTGTATSFDGTANITINTTSASINSAEVSDATSANTANMIVKRDGSGNFTAGTITATLNGTAYKIRTSAPSTPASGDIWMV